MKTKVLVSIDTELAKKLDEWASYKRMTRSSSVEYMIEKLDIAEANLGQFSKSLIYDPNRHGAVTYNLDNMAVILENDSSAKDAQHWVNRVVSTASTKMMNNAIVQVTNKEGMINTSKFGAMDSKTAEMIGVKFEKQKREFESKEYDTEGYPIPQD